MRREQMRWQSFERMRLPEALFGGMGHFGRPGTIDSLILEYGLALGYLESDRREAYNPPSVIVVEDGFVSEIFSWLKTFAPSTYPLSQFARVLSRNDWNRFSDPAPRAPRRLVREDRWSCVVLGELLAQGESDMGIEALPISWTAGCFSMTVARAAMVHSSDEATRTCVERLKEVENDRRFARRAVSVADLVPIWATVGSELEDMIDARQVVELVTSVISHAIDSASGTTNKSLGALRQPSGLASDSIEQRVIAFQRLIVELRLDYEEKSSPLFPSMVAAAAAFLVGRGTSHGFLLQHLPKPWNSAFSWFGLMAALAGPGAWDIAWSRAAKAAERLLRAQFDWSTGSTADLSWTEYAWMASTFAGTGVFGIEVPKMLPKVLSIEILPGALCQFRLMGDRSGSANVADRSRLVALEKRDKELSTTLEQLANLAARARNLMGRPSGRDPRDQGSFELEQFDDRYPKPSPSRGPKRKSD